MANNKRNPYLIPGAIILAGLLIAGAVLFKDGSRPIPLPTGGEDGRTQEDSSGDSLEPSPTNIRPVTEEDHIRGNPGASLTLVEFSDMQCPFCAKFHPTMQDLLEEYPDDLRWVYRHFPLSQIHPQATPAALASECVAELGGNDAFWQFTDRVFEGQKGMASSLYQEIAQDLGLDLEAFDTCVSSEKYAQRVQDDLTDAVKSGGRGTPYSVIIAANGDTFPFSGALPLAQIKVIIEQALQAE